MSHSVVDTGFFVVDTVFFVAGKGRTVESLCVISLYLGGGSSNQTVCWSLSDCFGSYVMGIPFGNPGTCK